MTQPNLAQRLAALPPEKQKQLLQRLQQQKTPDTIPQQPRGENQTFPLSFSQQRLWFLHQLERHSAFYNVPGAVQIDGDLDIMLLQQCFETIIRRHEVLRTHFELQGDAPRQVINPAPQLTIPLTDLQSLSAREQIEEIQKIIQAEARQPFDLSQTPLLRISLLRLHPQRHILLFILHHIVSDAWSRGVMLQEFTTLYHSLREKREITLPPLPIQYADFAVWQREQFAQDRFQSQLAYWQKQLSPLPPPLELPRDYPRQEVQTFGGGQVKLRLPKELTTQLQQLSNQENVTLFMTLLAGWQIFLSRYTGQTDIAVGSPIANRDRTEIENLIGFFTNTLVLRTDLAGDPSFREVLQRVRETALSAYSHQDIPFEKLVEVLQPERDLSRPPLFQVLFAFHDLPVLPELPDLDLTLLDVDSGTAKFDLSLLMRFDAKAGLVGILEYNSDLFAQETVARMADHLVMLLQRLVSSPEQPMTQVPLLTPTEVQQFAQWNDTVVNYPLDCVHHFFTQQVAKTPNQIALIAGEKRLIYQILNQNANQLAHYLEKQEIQPHDAIAISLGRNHFLPIAVLAVLKLGGTYVPLDPHYPQERLEFMLEDSQAKILLTQAEIASSLPTSTPLLELDTQWQEIVKESDENFDQELTPDALAYIIYTSGSTGKPKGVAMSHCSLSNLIHWQKDHSQEGLKTLQFASLSFDVSFQECFATWSSGGTLVMVSESQRRDPEQLLAIIDSQGIERLFLPFVALSQLAESSQHQDLVPTSLKEVITAGEQLQITPAIRSFFTKLPHCQLINQYGPSETHVVTAYPLTGNPENWSSLPPIGTPVANVQIYLLDDDQNQVPVGVSGEIYIGGVAVAAGYLNRPQLTAERFINRPLNKRLYKTGDLARYLPDGNLQYLGRKDDQVKVRGFRLELGEIEAVLAKHDAIAQVAATVKTDNSGNSRLIAYVVTQTSVTDDQLRQFLRKKLPSYSIPANFVFLDALPLTPSGKIDRRSLPEPQTRPQLETSYTAPASILEQQIADIWQNLLQVDRVGRDDNFFDLGGHSLMIVQVRSRLETLLNREIPLVTIFQHPTINALATALSQQSSGSDRLEATANRGQKRKQLLAKQRQRRQPPSHTSH